MAVRAITVAVILSLVAPAVAAERLAIIVNRDRPDSPSIEEVAQIYLRRKRFWADGSPIVPLNLPALAPLRERFSNLVLGPSAHRLADYWNRLYFRGVMPPTTLASTESVRRYVASDRNAIGYVPESQVDVSVRVLFRLEE